METRALRLGDQEAIAQIHAAMGMDYKMPMLAQNDFPQVIEHEGRVIGASMNRVVAETYLWLDPALHPADKFTAIRLMQANVLREAARLGWRELIAVIPTQIEKLFSRRLLLLNWKPSRTGWNLWGHDVPKGEARH